MNFVAKTDNYEIDYRPMRKRILFVILTVLLGLIILSSSCTQVAGLFDSSGTRFVVEILPEPGGGPIEAERESMYLIASKDCTSYSIITYSQ